MSVALGPEPTLISRKEVDVLYETLAAIRAALDRLKVDYIVTGGSLLGALRQHSLLFCDDDIDVTIIDTMDEHGTTAYERVSQRLGTELGDDYTYTIRPWEGGDKVRLKRMNSVFVDIFTLRRFESFEQLHELIGVKKNGQPQSDEYVTGIRGTIEACAASQGEASPLCPFWHFNTRKAVEMWPKEVYRETELFPLARDLKFGPLEGITGPRMPVLLLRRAFGRDCFEVYMQSTSHTPAKGGKGKGGKAKPDAAEGGKAAEGAEGAKGAEGAVGAVGVESRALSALRLGGGTWESSEKVQLSDAQYVPLQPTERAKRRPTSHGRESLFRYLDEQVAREEAWAREDAPAEGAATMQYAAAGRESSSGHTLGSRATPSVPVASPAADRAADLAADLAAGRLTMAQYASQARTAGTCAAEVTAVLKQHAAAKEPAVLLRADLVAGRLTMAEYAQQARAAGVSEAGLTATIKKYAAERSAAFMDGAR
jgi:hypothetical protein